jgi:hypothetical protein
MPGTKPPAAKSNAERTVRIAVSVCVLYPASELLNMW